MAFKTTHDNSGIGDTERHEEEPSSTFNERQEGDGEEYEDKDDADLRQTERSYFELNDSIDDTYCETQYWHERQDIDSDKINSKTENQEKNDESNGDTYNQTNKQSYNELKDGNCVDTVDCNEEEIRNEIPTEPPIFSRENECHTHSAVEDKRIVDTRNSGSQIPNLSTFEVPFSINECSELIENEAIDRKPHAEATEYPYRCNERTGKHTEFGKTYIAKKGPDTLEVQTENTEKRYNSSNDETNSSSDIYPEEPNQKEEENENAAKEGLKETTCSYSLSLVFIIVLLALGITAILTFDMQGHPPNNHPSIKLKVLSDLYKDDVSRCLKGLYNNSWQNDGFVYAVGDRGRPTYVPPIPPDEPDLPQPNITGNATRDVTQNGFNSSRTPAPELDRNESNTYTYIGVQELRICGLNDDNSTRHNDFRNDDPDDFISLRTFHNLRRERDSSTESLPNLENGSSQFEQACASFINLKYQDDHREVPGLSNLTCSRNNGERQVEPTCYYFDGGESTALLTRSLNLNVINQQQSEGQHLDDFANDPFYLREFESFISAGLSSRDVRARTFRDPRYPPWPHEYLSPATMADAGLYYTGIGDKAACFFCGNCMDNWKPGDVPFSEHKRLFPDCNYVRRHSTNTHQSQMFPQREQNRRSELISESLSGLENIETSSDMQAQNVLQPFPNDTGGSSAQQPKLKCDNLPAVSKKRTDSKLMNDRNDVGKMCAQDEDTRAVLPTRSSDNNRIRRTRRYSGSDTQHHSRRNNAYSSVIRETNSASDPALHNRVTTDIQAHYDDSQGGSNSQLRRMVSPSRNRLFVDRTTQRTFDAACENASGTLQTYMEETQDESNFPEAYPRNLFELDQYDVRNSESQHPSNTVRNRRSSSRIRQTGESTYDRATSRLLTISNNSLPSLSTRNVVRNSHQTTRHADSISERIGQRNRIEQILDSSSGRMVLDHGYQRSDVARAIEITLRARTTEREVGNIYQAIMIALSVLRARRRRCR